MKGGNVDKYTKFILTIIAVGIIGINFHFFKDEIISTAHAVEPHNHSAYEIYGISDHSHSLSSFDIYDFRRAVKKVIQRCVVSGNYLSC